LRLSLFCCSGIHTSGSGPSSHRQLLYLHGVSCPFLETPAGTVSAIHWLPPIHISLVCTVCMQAVGTLPFYLAISQFRASCSERTRPGCCSRAPSVPDRLTILPRHPRSPPGRPGIYLLVLSHFPPPPSPSRSRTLAGCNPACQRTWPGFTLFGIVLDAPTHVHLPQPRQLMV